jgi:hypothetical protein
MKELIQHQENNFNLNFHYFSSKFKISKEEDRSKVSDHLKLKSLKMYHSVSI